MEEDKQHIATLCALSTVGVAAAGLAFGVATDNPTTSPATHRKRKAPGLGLAGTSSINQPTPINKRIVSEPTVLQPKLDDSVHSVTFRTLFPRSIRRKSALLKDEKAANGVDPSVGSRESSLNRRNSLLRPWTALSRSTTPSTIDVKEAQTSNSWLKRMSVLSYVSRDKSPSPSVHDSVDVMPANKLVKRSSSQRVLLNASAPSLRRPATTHQRSATLSEWSRQSTQPADYTLTNDVKSNTSPSLTYRPFFQRGYPRKRYVSDGPRQSDGLRTISGVRQDAPALVLGLNVETFAEPDDQENERDANPLLQQGSRTRHKSRRSIASTKRFPSRRVFSEPVSLTAAHPQPETNTPNLNRSPISPLSHSSTFDIVLPQDTPSFRSSSPYVPSQRVFSRSKRDSIPSMPTTLSSDNDTRLFTDDDSMDFQSDTAFDSLATRATASSHSGLRPPYIETIFDEPVASHSKEMDIDSLEELMRKSHLDNTEDTVRVLPQGTADNVGIGINMHEDDLGQDGETIRKHLSTPSRRSASVDTEAFTTTPVPVKAHQSPIDLSSSPPVMPIPPSTFIDHSIERGHQGLDAMDLDLDDNIDWSPKSETIENLHPDAIHFRSNLHVNWPVTDDMDIDVRHTSNADKRSSIFDWSEVSQPTGPSDGPSPRPKTVHGKQGNENTRSRSGGRKVTGALHLRSQSVPVHRDSPVEAEPFPAAKFGTWGLGNKPVSEEWSDDFEFEDQDEPIVAPSVLENAVPAVMVQRDSIRSVKIPQTIIDRQASVHLQFGQVQEFMLLVEELKRLRTQGARLHLLDTHAKQLWSDAEAIINLATINEEEEDIPIPASPTTSDIFGDETPPLKRASKELPRRSDESRRDSIGRRSISSPAPPSFARARGESMAQAKSLIETIHQNRRRVESLAEQPPRQPQRKLPFDTQDLRDLVVRAGVITRALKDLVRKAEGVSVSPEKTPKKNKDPAFREIFNTPHSSPTPILNTNRLPQSRSANSYLGQSVDDDVHVDLPPSFKIATMV